MATLTISPVRLSSIAVTAGGAVSNANMLIEAYGARATKSVTGTALSGGDRYTMPSGEFTHVLLTCDAQVVAHKGKGADDPEASATAGLDILPGYPMLLPMMPGELLSAITA